MNMNMNMNMEEAKAPSKILEVCKISPSSPAPADFSLPLTSFDLNFFVSSPTERILYYNHHSDSSSILIPKLKHSLSLTLSHFLPLAGTLVWPDQSPEPIILYKPGDAVSLTIAQTDADFNRLSADHVRKATESHFLVPELYSSDDSVSPAMRLQITLFTKNSGGFSIGIVTNHVVVDGKTSTLFLKSWASICKLCLSSLPPELTPDFDRTAIRDPNGSGWHTLYQKFFGIFSSSSGTGRKKMRLTPKAAISDDMVAGTFQVTRAGVENLRRKATNSNSRRHLTTFVLTLAHVSICLIKSERLEPESKIGLFFLVDWRLRSGAPVGPNYFGNGVNPYGVLMEAREFEEENAMGVISNKISDAIAEVTAEENRAPEMLDELMARLKKEMPICRSLVAAGSPRFGVYETDFGWGRCKKVEVASITPSGTFSMVESRNGDGGLEIGILLPHHEMDVFSSLFYQRLN